MIPNVIVRKIARLVVDCSFEKYSISTGPLEGTNNKIKTMKRQAYGYRDEEYLYARRPF